MTLVDVDAVDPAEAEVGEDLRVHAGVAAHVQRRLEARDHAPVDQLAQELEEEVEPQAVEDPGLDVVRVVVEPVQLHLVTG